MNFLKKIQKRSDIKDYPAHTEIFAEDDPAEALYIVISGELELTLGDDLLSTESETSVIGEMALIEDARQGTTASTLSEVKLVRLNREQLHDFMLESPEFSLHVMNTLATRLRLVDEYNTTSFE